MTEQKVININTCDLCGKEVENFANCYDDNFTKLSRCNAAAKRYYAFDQCESCQGKLIDFLRENFSLFKKTNLTNGEKS